MLDRQIVSVKDQIAEQLRSDIISGELSPGEKLNEVSLTKRFGVSRGPIRDVFLELTKEGLLASKNNCGVSVNHDLSPALQGLMVEIRRTIETFAITQHNDPLNEEDFDNLDAIIGRIREAFKENDFTAVTKADIEFHRYLVFKAGGAELANLWYTIVLRMRMNYRRLSTAKDCVDEHQAIIDALRNKDLALAKERLIANIK